MTGHDPIPPSVWIPAALDRLHRKVCRACGRNVADVEWVCPVCLAPWHVAPGVRGWFGNWRGWKVSRFERDMETTLQPREGRLMPVTCPCHAEPYRTVRVDEFTYQVCAMVVRAIEEGWRSDDSRLPAFDTLDMIREAVVEAREACASIADEACERNRRLADEHEAAPDADYIDPRAKSELVASFAHVAHEAYDIAAAIRARKETP